MSDFPQTLKHWRKERRFSQLQLAMEAEISSRHLSFLETGRANPSPEMIGRLGEALQLPLSARNQMLTHAGFAARYPGRQWEEAEMVPVRAALEHMLQAHAPYPAIALDRLWTLVRMNQPAQILFGQLNIREGDSLLEVIMSDAMPVVIENWPEVARHTLQRLRTESAAAGGIAELDQAADHLSRVHAEGREASAKIGPVVPTVYRAGNLRLALFGTIAQFGTPEDLTLEDLKIELFFPGDAATDQALRAMAG